MINPERILLALDSYKELLKPVRSPNAILSDGTRTRAAGGFTLRVLRFQRIGNNIEAMSTTAEAVLVQFRALARDEQWAVYEEIARSVVPQDYGPHTDDELTATAAQTFALFGLYPP